MNPSTIQQLDEWMITHCYNNNYAIGNRRIHEGYGLDSSSGTYVWYYTERGQRENLHYFGTEQEAVAYAFRMIAADNTARQHLVGFIKKGTVEIELLAELENRNVLFWKDEIPYGGLQDKRVRIFVFGCDLQKVQDLQKKYNDR